MGTSSPWAPVAILTAILLNTCQAQSVPLLIKKNNHDSEKAIEISKLTLVKESEVYVDQNKNYGIQGVPKENAQNRMVPDTSIGHNFQSTKESQKINTPAGKGIIEERISHNPTSLNTHPKEFEKKEKHAFDALPLSIESHRGANIQRSQQYNNHNDDGEIPLKDFDSFPSKRQTEWTIGQKPRAETNTFVQREPSYVDERDSYLPMNLAVKSENRQETSVHNSDRFYNVDNWRESPTLKYDDFTESVIENRKSFTKSDSTKNVQRNYEDAYNEDSLYDSRPSNERTPVISDTEDVRPGRTGRRPLRDEEERRPLTPRENGQYHLPLDSIYCKEPETWRPNYDTKETRQFNDKSSVRREPVYDKEVVPPSKDDRYADSDYEENRPNGWDVQRPEEPPNYEETDDFKDDYARSRDNSSRSTRENNSGYSGFPESYQPDINHHYSKPLQYEPVRAFPASPCHNVFKYEGREPEEDRWYANIYVSSDEILNGIRLDITLDRPSELLTNWLADVKTKDSIHFTILSLNHKLMPGPPETVRIMVKFNGKKQVPYLKSINLNGRLICPSNRAQKTTTRRPVYENPGDLQLKRTTLRYVEPSKRPVGLNDYESNTKRTTAYVERHTTSSYEDDRKSVPRSTSKFHQPNPNGYEETDQNTFVSAPSKKPHGRPAHSNGKPPPHAARPAQGIGPSGGQSHNKGQGQSQASNNKGGNKGHGLSTSGGNFKPNNKPNFSQDPQGEIECGKPSVQPSPLITHGQHTSRGQWPWHVALYKNVGTDLTFFCGGSLINTKYVLTAAHCVTKTYTTKPLDENTLVVYLGKYHLKLWSEGGVQNRQVSKIYVHSQYNSTDFRSDIAVLALSTPVEYSDYVRPICLWDRSNTRIEDVEGTMGTVVGWGFDENKMLTEELRQAKMPVVEQKTCLWSYPDFYPQFTSNMTYCAGFKNGTSVCNGDSGGGMVFPFKDRYGAEKWYLRGIVSISPARNDSRVCDTSHYVIFTDVAKYLPWLSNFI